MQPEETAQHSRRRKKEASKRPSRKEKFEARQAAANNSASDAGTAGAAVKNSKNGRKKKYRLNWKRFLLIGFSACFCLCLILGLLVGGWVYSIIRNTPDIDTSNINAMLSQNSTLYDDEGEIIDTVVGSDGAKRTIVELRNIPDDLQHAFIALEDKTFQDHHGFNIVRIFGAIKEWVFTGDLGGTSTITQQLARNVYLPDTMQERTLTRKIKEAYYTVILEKRLNKDQILEAYLNTVNFGQAFGVQAAAQAYFSKDVSDLTLAECASLAAMPQLPTYYALVVPVSATEVNDETENLILRDGDMAYLWNDTAKDRIQTCLALMLEQGYINEAEYNEAKSVEIKDMVNPNTEMLKSKTNYFADYVIKTVISDLQTELGYDYAKAYDLVYSGGIQIYTTVDMEIQEIVEKEMENNANFPTLVVSRKDKDGNILDEFGNIMLYKFSNYVTSKGYFRLEPDEYEWNSDGSLTVYKGKRLHLYDTTVGGKSDVSVEFKNMYVYDENNVFYTIAGGYLNIPMGYKSKDSDGNLVISAQFFEDYPDILKQSGERVVTKNFTLQQQVIQPQSAMTIIDNETGHVKAMVGGRKVNGRMILNRAVATRQSGSSIKPLTVYAGALQRSFELEAEGETFPLVDSDYGNQGDQLWGNYLTAGSIVDDEPTVVNGEDWPTNSPKGFDGLITIRRALQKSLNICAVKIMQQTGTDYCFDLAEKFGLTTLVREGEINDNNLAALALGGQTDGVTTLEMASAYTTFVNEGVHKSYNVYTKVTTRNGEILLETDTTETEVLDPGVAWIMRDMLQSDITEGIAGPAAVRGAKAGGKTGTTSDQFDIWFDGFTAKYSAALWIGSDINIKLSTMSGTAAALWGKIMNQIPDVADGTYSARPSNVISVEIDTKSGMLATDASGKDTRTEYFTRGTQPTETDTVHQTADVCMDSEFLATPSCPDYETVSGIMRPYEANKKCADYDRELPHYFCNEHNPDPEIYPVEEGLDVTIVLPGELEEPDSDEDLPFDPFYPSYPETGDGIIQDDPDDIVESDSDDILTDSDEDTDQAA